MRITVKDFQSLGHVVVEASGLTVLVGPSNRGKSALIRAIEAALFNRPNAEFVRLGTKKAIVTIEGLPDADPTKPTHQLTWAKGKSTNVLTFDGVDFKKIGKGVPPAVEEAGYRAIWVGDRERKSGAYLRVQIADQFDPLFLLKGVQPSFVAEALGVISRHTVLIHAQERAASDQRSIKQRQGLRDSDLVTARQQLAALDAVPAFADRVRQLVLDQDALTRRRAQLARLVLLAEARRHAVALLRAPLPAAVPVPTDLGAQVARVGHLQLQRLQLQLLLRHAIPRPTPLQPDLGAIERRVTELGDRRRRLVAVLQPPFPASTVVDPQLGLSYAPLAARAAHREVLTRLVTHPWPAEGTAAQVGVIEQQQQWLTTLRTQADHRRLALDYTHQTTAAYSAAAVELETTQAALELAWQDLQVCPLCERPLPDHTQPE